MVFKTDGERLQVRDNGMMSMKLAKVIRDNKGPLIRYLEEEASAAEKAEQIIDVLGGSVEGIKPRSGLRELIESDFDEHADT